MAMVTAEGDGEDDDDDDHDDDGDYEVDGYYARSGVQCHQQGWWPMLNSTSERIL